MKPKLCIAVPHSGRSIMPQWRIATQQLIGPKNTIHAWLYTLGQKMDEAYNALAEQSIALGAEFTLFLDDDTEIPPNTLPELMKVLDTSHSDVMACGGIYTTREHPIVPLVFQGLGQGSFWKWKAGEVFPCYAVGSGAMMVRNEVFSKLSKPWFKDIQTVDEIEQYRDVFSFEELASARISVDIFFCQKLAKAGYKVLAHGGILPIHWGPDNNPYYLPADSYPMRIAKAHRIQGWMTPPELSWLATQAESHKQIVEVGSFQGRSTRALGDYACGTVWAFDDWQGCRDIQMSKNGEFFHAFEMNLYDLLAREKVKIIKGDHGDESLIPDIQPDMVFIDGSHYCEDVRRDIQIWKKRMAPGGLLCGHDIITGSKNDIGVLPAVKQEFGDSWHVVPNTDIWAVTV
jgi:Methyltransferase domain